MMDYSRSKEINLLVRQLVREGWQFQRGGKHGKLYPPNQEVWLSVPITPSDRRAFLNFRQDIRRAKSLT